MFMTAGSCSVMLVCPTRRIFCCQDCVAWSIEARRGGSGMSFGLDTLEDGATFPSADSVETGPRASGPTDIGMTAAPVMRPVFKKLRRLSIGTPLCPCEESLIAKLDARTCVSGGIGPEGNLTFHYDTTNSSGRVGS